MLSTILDIILDALLDSAKMLPFLYLTFLLMEFIEHHAADKLALTLEKAGHSNIGGAAVGAALGCVPQCGFSIAASNLFSSRIIGAGTLMAVFISTSDEAIPILLAHPDQISSLWKLIAAKFIIAIIAGALFGILIKLFVKEPDDAEFDQICTTCGCDNHSIWLSAFHHTLEIFVFILIVNLIMNSIMEFAGQDNVSAFLNGIGFLQPFASALVGLIPNCAASVIITELYASGSISFGTAVGGLCTGAGVGLAVLFRTNKNLKENIIFLVYLYFIGVLSGSVLNLFC